MCRECQCLGELGAIAHQDSSSRGCIPPASPKEASPWKSGNGLAERARGGYFASPAGFFLSIKADVPLVVLTRFFPEEEHGTPAVPGCGAGP